ncbi:MAG: tyrosine-type recombinase/integrase [Acidobacteriota bacterium]
MTNPEGWQGDTGQHVRYLIDDQVDAFFKAVEANTDPALRVRDTALFRLMLSYGLRCKEAEILTIPHDVDLASDPPRLWVTRVKEKHWRTDPKTGEKRYIKKDRRGHWYPLTRRNVERLKAWLSVRRKFTKAKDGPLFITIHGEPITANYIYHITARYGAKAGIEGLYPHQFRHTAAIRLAREGASAFAIKEALGHVSVLSSEHYVTMAGPARLKMDLASLERIEGADE